MNDQKRGVECLFTVRQLMPGQQADWQRDRSRRYVVIVATLLVTISLLLISASLLATWGHAAQFVPGAQHQALVTHEISRVQQPTATTQATPTPLTALLASRVDGLLQSKFAHQQFSGSVLIAHNGQVLLSKGYGMADWDHQVPNTPDTRFFLGSVTKQFTAMAILILQEQGKLQVHDRLCLYLTNCPSAWQPVTIHEVLTHTSGIPQLGDSQVSDASPEAWIGSFDDVPLEFPAGSHSDYCSICYQILAYVVERVSGGPYSQFLQQEIFDPLQMRDTGFDSNAYYSQPDHAVGYASWQVKAVQLGWSVGPQWSFLSGSGLLYTTVGDLYRWDQALYTNTLVSRHSLDEAFTPYVTSDLFPTSKYGYGWFITKAPEAGHQLIWHDGVIDGFRTYIGRYVDDRVTIILLSNLATLDTLGLVHSIEQIVFAG